MSLGAATWALTEAGPRGWDDPAIAVSASIALLGVAAFVFRMLHARNPLVPPTLFESREFTVTNLATVLMYAAIGVTFFLVAYELQVGAGWKALEAGAALLPATVLMVLFSAKSGELAQRIGPRLQLTAGPLIAACGLLLLSRIGPDASWARDVLPGSLVFGFGLVTFVAPLTATVMGSVSPDHVSIASGVNNAVARTASLASLSVIPVVSGLSTATGATEVTHALPRLARARRRPRRCGRPGLLHRPRYSRSHAGIGTTNALRHRRSPGPARPAVVSRRRQSLMRARRGAEETA